jgi:hypothetical protein
MPTGVQGRGSRPWRFVGPSKDLIISEMGLERSYTGSRVRIPLGARMFVLGPSLLSCVGTGNATS